MKFISLVTAAATAATTTTAIPLQISNNLNLNNHNELKFDETSQHPIETPVNLRHQMKQQLKTNHMDILNRVQKPRSLEETKPYVDLDSKDYGIPFVPPSSTEGEELESTPALDSTEDEDPVADESSQTSDVEPPSAVLPAEPLRNDKPMPKEKPEPADLLPHPPILGVKPPPLGAPEMKPKDKPIPKDKPMPKEKPEPADSQPRPPVLGTPLDEATQTPETDLLAPPLKLMPKAKPNPKEKPEPERILAGPVHFGAQPPPPGEPTPIVEDPPAERILAGPPHFGAQPPPPGEPTPIVEDPQTPKSEPQPRSLLGLLGFADGPVGKPKPGPKDKPAPKGKPMPAPPQQFLFPPMNSPDIELYSQTPLFSKSNENSVLNAKMNLLASPHSEDYSDEAYVTIQAVQDYCAVDYTKYCSPMFQMGSISSPLDTSSQFVQFSGGWNVDDDSVGDDDTEPGIFFVGFINSIFDIFNNVLGEPTSAVVMFDVTDDETQLPPQHPPCKRNSMSQSMTEPSQYRLLHEQDHHSHGDEHFEGPTDSQFFNKPPPAKPRPRAGPHSAGSHDDHEFKHSHDSEDSHGSAGRPFFEPMPPPPPATFLGYGQDGDMCLMANYQSLSTPCQSAIDDAYVLRDQYVVEEEHSPRCAFAAGVFITLALVGIVLCLLRRRRQKVLDTLKAIHQDPELKARVEAASRIPVPQPCGAKKDNQPCRARKCFNVLLRIMVTLALSFLLVNLAARATLAIINGMIYTDEETGETVEPKPVSVLLVFISFLVAEIMMIVAIKKLIVSCGARRRARAFASSGTSPSTSTSPPPPPAAPNGGLGRYFATIPLPSPKFSFFRTAPSHSYAPLMTDEESNTEMIQSPHGVVVASAPLQPQVFYVPPTMPSHVTAQSISSVSMI